MQWVGIFFLLGGAGAFLSNKKSTGISIGGYDVKEETGKQYGQGCLFMLIGCVILYFATK
jgi:hypothetical protein